MWGKYNNTRRILQKPAESAPETLLRLFRIFGANRVLLVLSRY